MDTWRAVQRVHFQAGIVGEGVEVTAGGGLALPKQPSWVGGNPLRELQGLLNGVACEVRSVFDDSRGIWKIPQGAITERLAEDRLDLVRFVRVASGNDECCHARSLAGVRARKASL